MMSDDPLAGGDPSASLQEVALDASAGGEDAGGGAGAAEATAAAAGAAAGAAGAAESAAPEARAEQGKEGAGGGSGAAEGAGAGAEGAAGGAAGGVPGGAALEGGASAAAAAPTEAGAGGASAALPAVESMMMRDARFESVATSEVGEVGDAGEAGGAAASQAPLKVSITEPLKRSEGGALGRSYVTYKVTTSSSLPGYRTASTGGSMVVRRRFRDFVGLHDDLCEAHRGYFVPPRPEKDALASSSDQEFIEYRRHALEQWLSRLAAHPVLASSPHLIRFLETDGDLPTKTALRKAMNNAGDAASTLGSQMAGSSSANTPNDAAVASKPSSNPLRWLKEKRQGVMNGMGKPSVTEDDTDYLTSKLAFSELEKLLGDASTAAEGVVQSLQDLSDTHASLGLELIKLAKFEEASEYEASAPAVKAFGGSAVRLSRLQRSATGQAVQVLQPLHEHLGLMPAVHAAGDDRKKALLTVQTLNAEIDRKRAAVSKLEAKSGSKLGGDASITGKLAEVGRELATAESACVVAKEQYALIKERNAEEFERLNKERKAAFTTMLVHFAKSQANYADRAAALYSACATEIEVNTAAGAKGKGKAPAAEE